MFNCHIKITAGSLFIEVSTTRSTNRPSRFILWFLSILDTCGGSCHFCSNKLRSMKLHELLSSPCVELRSALSLTLSRHLASPGQIYLFYWAISLVVARKNSCIGCHCPTKDHYILNQPLLLRIQSSYQWLETGHGNGPCGGVGNRKKWRTQL